MMYKSVLIYSLCLFTFLLYTMTDKYILISYKRNRGTATANCNMTSGGVINAPTMSKIKYAYLRVFRKNCGVKIPRLVKNIIITVITNKSTKGSNILLRNLKYTLNVNNSMKITSCNNSKKGNIKLINT